LASVLCVVMLLSFNIVICWESTYKSAAPVPVPHAPVTATPQLHFEDEQQRTCRTLNNEWELGTRGLGCCGTWNWVWVWV